MSPPTSRLLLLSSRIDSSTRRFLRPSSPHPLFSPLFSLPPPVAAESELQRREERDASRSVDDIHNSSDADEVFLTQAAVDAAVAKAETGRRRVMEAVLSKVALESQAHENRLRAEQAREAQLIDSIQRSREAVGTPLPSLPSLLFLLLPYLLLSPRSPSRRSKTSQLRPLVCSSSEGRVDHAAEAERAHGSAASRRSSLSRRHSHLPPPLLHLRSPRPPPPPRLLLPPSSLLVLVLPLLLPSSPSSSRPFHW